MKIHEDLARIRVNQALQEGLASQRAHRSRSKKSYTIFKIVVKKITHFFRSNPSLSKKSQPKASDLRPELAKR